MKQVLKSIFKKWPTTLWIIKGLYYSPVFFVFSFFRSLIITKTLTGRFFPISVRVGVGQRFRVKRERNAKVLLRGVLAVNQWNGSSLPASLF